MSSFIHFHSCRVPRPSHYTWLHYNNDIWPRVYTTGLLIGPVTKYFKVHSNTVPRVLFSLKLNVALWFFEIQYYAGLLSPHASSISSTPPLHPSPLILSSNICCRMQISNLLVMQFSSCLSVPHISWSPCSQFSCTLGLETIFTRVENRG